MWPQCHFWAFPRISMLFQIIFRISSWDKVRLNYPFYFTFIYNLWQFSLFVNYLWQQATVCFSASISQKCARYSLQFVNTRIILEKKFHGFLRLTRARIRKRLRSRRIDSKNRFQWIDSASECIAWRAGTTNIGLLYRPARQNLWWMAFISNIEPSDQFIPTSSNVFLIFR
jgi:hypothetical protein